MSKPELSREKRKKGGATGMNMAVYMDVEELLIMGDSDLIIRKIQGEWENKDIKLIPYREHVEDLRKRFKSIEFRYNTRFHNELADALATLASMLPYPGNIHIDPLKIQIRERHGYCNKIEIGLDVQPWYHDIKRFLKIKEYPEQASGDQKRTIRRLASSFFLSREVLYKRTPYLNLLSYGDEGGSFMAGHCRRSFGMVLLVRCWREETAVKQHQLLLLDMGARRGS
uniref:Uncharacterized protein LOC104227000 n=1 Tax=Nicotiana sylvestris TaxID=4096 RepID=A0A1U7WBR3_NICSY|nr:PREDICTED: uncharacterized protein LOC104227000 [Nicotiana sylvestris]